MIGSLSTISTRRKEQAIGSKDASFFFLFLSATNFRRMLVDVTKILYGTFNSCNRITSDGEKNDN